jgi:hypothetical protein
MKRAFFLFLVLLTLGGCADEQGYRIISRQEDARTKTLNVDAPDWALDSQMLEWCDEMAAKEGTSKKVTINFYQDQGKGEKLAGTCSDKTYTAK